MAPKGNRGKPPTMEMVPKKGYTKLCARRCAEEKKKHTHDGGSAARSNVGIIF